jgi:GH24 family phage-related lysozyme (muramidase)
LNYLTDGDVDLTNLDAPVDLLTGSVTGTDTGDVGLTSGVDAIEDIIQRLDTEGLDSFVDDSIETEFDAFPTSDGVVTRDEIEADLFGEDYTPTSAELAAQLEDAGLSDLRVDSGFDTGLMMTGQGDTNLQKIIDDATRSDGFMYIRGEGKLDPNNPDDVATLINSLDLGNTLDDYDAKTSLFADDAAAEALESGLYDDVILDTGEGGLGSDADNLDDLMTTVEDDTTGTTGDGLVAGSFENLLNTQPVDQSEMDIIANTIRELEGFGSDTYFDVNAERAGYGSDTKTDPVTGEVTKIEPGMTVTREEAEADLNRRLTQNTTLSDGTVQKGFIPSVVDAVGADTFYAMAPTTQAALVSIAYNYGANWAEKLPSLAEAAKTGNTDLIADAIDDRGADNDGINAVRRLREAEMVRSGVPLGGDTDVYAEDDVALAGTPTGKGTGVEGADTDIVTEVTGDTGQTATQAYLSAMTKLDNPETMTMMEQQALYGARGQVPNAAETAYLNALLRDAKHKEDGPIGKDGNPIYEAGDYVVQQTGAEQFEDLIVKGIDFFLNPLTILGDKYSLENMNETYVQEQLDAYKNGGTFVYDGAGTVVGIADANYDADGDGENDSVVLLGDDGEYTVSSGRVGVEDVDNSNQYSDTDEDIDDIDIVDSNTTYENTEDGVVTKRVGEEEEEETGSDDSIDPCPEGFILDPVLGEGVPIDEVDATAGTPSLGDVIRPDTGSGTPTPTPTPAPVDPMIIRGPKQFNVGGAVTPNIDRFMQSLGA